MHTLIDKIQSYVALNPHTFAESHFGTLKLATHRSYGDELPVICYDSDNKIVALYDIKTQTFKWTKKS